MSNIREDRHVEGDWWPDPIPPNVEFAEGFIARARKSFESFGAKHQAPSLSAGMFRVMPGVRFLSANTADARSVISRCSTAR